MKRCQSCSSPIRDEAVFCPNCGTPLVAGAKREPEAECDRPVTTVPLITLAPEENNFSKQRLIRYGKLLVGTVLVMAVALAVAAGAAWLQSKPLKQSSIESVETDSYRKCIALVADVRNDNFDNIVNDLITMSGDAENYNFLEEYEALFKQLVPDESSDATAIKFRNCCFMVSFTEFQAKRLENLAGKTLIGALYREDANSYRSYADELWDMLNSAESDLELQQIIDYCADRDIITLKQQPTATTAPAA